MNRRALLLIKTTTRPLSLRKYHHSFPNLRTIITTTTTTSSSTLLHATTNNINTNTNMPSTNQITASITTTTTTTSSSNNHEHNHNSNNNTDTVVHDIEDLHLQALNNGQTKYIDPITGYTVFTELVHLKRGTCCGNSCRHCPYGWENVRKSKGNNKNNNAAIPPTAKLSSGDFDKANEMIQNILNNNNNNNHNKNGNKNDNINGNNNNIKGRQTSSPSSVVSAAAVNSTITNTQPVSTSATTSNTTIIEKNVPYTRHGDYGTSQLATGGGNGNNNDDQQQSQNHRIRKDDRSFEALGTIDELCCVVGVVHAQLISMDKNSSNSSSSSMNCEYGDLPEWLLDVMSRLFDIGSHIAKPEPPPSQQQENTGNDDDGRNDDDFIAFDPLFIKQLEEWINIMTNEMPELTSFILPTGSVTSAQLHVARTVCRRAERTLVPWLYSGSDSDSSGSSNSSGRSCNNETTTTTATSLSSIYKQFDGRDPNVLKYVNRLSDFLFTAARWVNYCEGKDEVLYRQPSTTSTSTSAAAIATATAKGDGTGGRGGAASATSNTIKRTRVTRSLREEKEDD